MTRLTSPAAAHEPPTRPLRLIVALAALLLTTAVAGAQEETATGAGHWQTADAAEVARLIDGFLGDGRTARASRPSRALLVPQVTDADSGSVAGKAVVQCPRDTERVVLLAATAGAQAQLPEWDSLRTALGAVAVDRQAVEACRARPGLTAGGSVGAAEEAMASVLPFLQRRLKGPFRAVPVAVGVAADPALLVQALLPLLRDERTALVATTEAGFGPAELEALFEPADHARSGGPHALPAHLVAVRGLASELGWKPVVAAHLTTATATVRLSALLIDDPNRTDLLAQAAKATWDDPLTRAAFEDAGRAAGRADFRGELLSQPEQEVLLWLARQTILCKLKGNALPTAPLYSDTLSAPAGCFVTLHQGGKLRGSIGTILPKDPLAAAVQRYALAAALEDKRFTPLTEVELATTQIEISVLTAPRRIGFRDGADLLGKLRPGVHGVLLTYENSRRATFLPQVWAQIGDTTAFLQALCRKSGIPLDAWQDPAKTTIELYETFDIRETPK